MIKIKCKKCGEEFKFSGLPYRTRGKITMKVKCFNCGKMIEVKLNKEKK